MKQTIFNISVAVIVFYLLFTSRVSLLLQRFNESNPQMKSVAETEVVLDTGSTKVDTITFEQEMAIVDSVLKAADGITYTSSHGIPNYEADMRQTLVSYPNGMPKIMARISCTDNYDTCWINNTLGFLDEHGRLIALLSNYRSKNLYWRCAKNRVFHFKNPNLCRNIKRPDADVDIKSY